MNIVVLLPIYTTPSLYPANIVPVFLASAFQIVVAFDFTSLMLDTKTIFLMFDLFTLVFPKNPLAPDVSVFVAFRLLAIYILFSAFTFPAESFNVPAFNKMYASFAVVEIPLKVIVS